jgi:hypothetical protein
MKSKSKAGKQTQTQVTADHIAATLQHIGEAARGESPATVVNAVASPPTGIVSRPGHYNQQQMVDLWKGGSSIAQIATAVGCTPVYARRVLSTKTPELYAQGLQLRAAHRASSPVPSNVLPVAPPPTVVPITNGKTVNGKNGKEAVQEAISVIARAVAASAFAGAQYVPRPQSREEMFAAVEKGVRAGVKKLGIGFHS